MTLRHLFAGALLAIAVASPVLAQVDPARLMTDVGILAADDMEGRAAGTPGGERARAYIVSRFESLGLTAPTGGQLQPFTRESRRGPVSGANVLGVIRGTRTPDRWILVTAHYDHLGVRDGRIFNGADDNASGVASLLALARQLRERPPEHSVLFIAFDAEERGLVGARHYVENPVIPLASTALILNMDMTARQDSGRLWVTGTYQHPTFRPPLEAFGAVGPVTLAFGKDTPQDVGENNWVMLSDQGPFAERGVPFLLFSADYHPDYHQPSDDTERVRPEVLGAATELIVRSFRALDAQLDAARP